MTPEQVKFVQDSFARVVPIGGTVANHRRRDEGGRS
jgi:hypothetical protein